MDLLIPGAFFLGILLGYFPWSWFPQWKRQHRKGGTLHLSGLRLSHLDKKDL